jgi:hypothetical protein
MAVKTRIQLKDQSNNTFLDNTSGAIIPENHRIWNDDTIDSVATLSDENIFSQTQTFEESIQSQGDNTFSGQNSFEAQTDFLGQVKVAKFVQTQIATYISADTNVDLTNVEGNIIYIDGTTTISSFTGSVGQIFYVTFVDGLLIDAQGGASVRPPHNIEAKAGDTFIFHFTEENVIRVLGYWRQNGQNWFILADLSAYTTLQSNSSFQIGAEYLVLNCYEYPTDFIWSVLVRAYSSSTIDSTAYIRRNGAFIPVAIADGTLDPGTLPISTMSTYNDRLTLAEWLVNPGSPQWTIGGSAVVELPGKPFLAHAIADASNTGIRRNLLNFYNSAEPYFGRILFSELHSENRFYSHDGNYSSWGNNLDFEAGITPTNLTDWNVNNFANDPLITSIIASYVVVNDTCTIHFQMTGEGKFDQGASGHEFHLYMPLPFESVGNYCGHGSVRFTDINSHEDNGAIVVAIDQYSCLFSSKWSNAISSSTGIIASGSYTFKAIGENLL